MKFNIITIFPEIINNYFQYGILSKAIKNNLLEINTIDLKKYSGNKWHKVDDEIYGCGKGMLIKAEPIKRAIDSLEDKGEIIYLTPQGRKFDNRYAKSLAEKDVLTVVCGRYEGFDARIKKIYPGESISIGDYVLSGGELAALVIIDSVARYINGVIEELSFQEESFENHLLENEHYTRPFDFEGYNVPEILLSGNEKEIRNYRLMESYGITLLNRPDIYTNIVFNDIKDGLDSYRKIEKKNRELKKIRDYLQKYIKEFL